MKQENKVWRMILGVGWGDWGRDNKERNIYVQTRG